MITRIPYNSSSPSTFNPLSLVKTFYSSMQTSLPQVDLPHSPYPRFSGTLLYALIGTLLFHHSTYNNLYLWWSPSLESMLKDDILLNAGVLLTTIFQHFAGSLAQSRYSINIY